MAVLENSKCAFQKLYEKWQMIKGARSVQVMAAQRGDHLELFLAVKNRPIAKLMTALELGQFSPDFEKTRIVADIFESMAMVDPRSDGEWDELVGNGFEDEFLQRVDEVAEG